ncbi:MAG TPA: aromatic ring-hydroxylating dioxygenase subunit alpha [Candidatus Limnocylindrales bacterium]|nr:aromatic ring-hydroxylating dioxygenase subunit alpha [Candidatus Limnocylindrales bacterium]
MDAVLEPVAQAQLQGTLAPFGASAGLPGDAYRSPATFAWELRHFFEGGWVCVGRADDLSQPGDRRAVRVGTETAVLVRDTTGTLRAFFNVCRHRGHELLQAGESGSGETVECPYHGWEYALDGRLRSAPRLGRRTSFQVGEHGLAPMRLAQWHGFAFVNVSGDAPDLQTYLGNVEAYVQPYAPESLISAARTEYVVRANWKLIGENYHECYHCPKIHPELCRVTPPDSGENSSPDGAWVGGSMDLMDHAQTMSMTGESRGEMLPGLNAKQRRQVYYIGLFPNLYVSMHPDYVLTHRVEPLTADSSRVECEWLFPPEALARPGFDPTYATEFWDVTNKEDWAACESVQRGTSSRAYKPGPISGPEDAVYQFVTMVADGYLNGRAQRPRVPPR